MLDNFKFVIIIKLTLEAKLMRCSFKKSRQVELVEVILNEAEIEIDFEGRFEIFKRS